MPDDYSSPSCALAHLLFIKIFWDSYPHCHHFTDDEIKEETSKVTHPKSQSYPSTTEISRQLFWLHIPKGLTIHFNK